MGSIVEVRQHFPYTMIGAERHESHQTQHRTSLLRSALSDSSSTPTIHAPPSVDVSMTDVMSAPVRPTPHPAVTRQVSQSGTRELAYHNAIPSQHTSSNQTSPHHMSSATTQESPVRANAIHSSANFVQGSSSASSVQGSPVRSPNTQSPLPSPPPPPRIKVKSLSHIQSFVIDDQNPLSPSRVSSRVSGFGRREISPQYEISDMPVAEIIEMVAGLLTKITTTNDRQHEYLHRQMPHEGSNSLNQQTTSVLAFHGKNVPSISILSYLSRIHKYCPTTYEVFLSLLVYFDRMTERVNAGQMMSLRQANQQSLDRLAAKAAEEQGILAKEESSQHGRASAHSTTPPHSGSLAPEAQSAPLTTNEVPPSPPLPTYPSVEDQAHLSHFFVVDSFNIHRLVIAGVTCASKFFSDVFYTNSRYAKVRYFRDLQVSS